MSEFNFDKMKNINIPESFVDAALNVPKNVKSPVPFLKYSKIIAFAASIVLVCSLSVALFFITNSKVAVPPVKDNVIEFNTQTQKSSDITENTENSTEKNTQKDSTDNTEAETELSTEVLKTFEPNEETETPSDNEETNSNSTPLKPDSNPEKPDNTKPIPTQNIEKPTINSPTEKPTEDFTADEPPQESPPDEPDKLSYIDRFTNGKITANIHYTDYSDNIYCRLYDSKGYLIGDKDLFSANREATKVNEIMTDDSEHSVYEYDIDSLGENLKKGSYEVVFYNEKGWYICTGYINIS